MSSRAPIGVFGVLNQRNDYNSMLPKWHSCFLLKHVLPPSYFDSKIYGDFIEKNFKNPVKGFVYHNTGSLVEGLAIPLMRKKQNSDDVDLFAFQTDRDVMLEMPYRAKYSKLAGTLTLPKYMLKLVDMDPETPPGFALLEYFDGNFMPKSTQTGNTPKYFPTSSSLDFCDHFLNTYCFHVPPLYSMQHGPAISFNDGSRGDSKIDKDFLFVVRCVVWPKVADNWFKRRRTSGWPTIDMRQNIHDSKCHLVPTPHPKTKRERKWKVGFEWRLSFSIAEKKLARTLTNHQRLCYVYFKTLITIYTKLPSYFCKTVLFGVCEDVPQKWWCDDTILQGLMFLLGKMLHFLLQHNLPNYFIPESNLLNDTPSYLIRDSAKQIVLLHRRPLHNLFEIMNSTPYLTDYQMSLLHVCEAYEVFQDFFDGNTSSCEFQENFLKSVRIVHLDYLIGKTGHNAEMYFELASTYQRLAIMNSIGTDLGPIFAYTKRFSLETKAQKLAVAIDNVCKSLQIPTEQNTEQEQPNFTRVYLRKAEILHYYSQTLSSVQKLEILKETETWYEEIVHNTKAVQKGGQQWGELLCKYANFLYQTKTNLKKAEEILKDLIKTYETNCPFSVIFHKEQYLTLDETIRQHYKPGMTYLQLQLKPFVHYLLVTVLKESNDHGRAVYALHLFEKYLSEEVDKPRSSLKNRDVQTLHPLYLLGHCYNKLGKSQQAKTAYEIASNVQQLWKLDVDTNESYKLVRQESSDEQFIIL